MESAFDISASALRAQRVRMNVIAHNVANANTTRDVNGEPMPYRRRMVIFREGAPEMGHPKDGVSVLQVMEDPTEFRLEWNPDHPDAIKDGPQAGYVRMPNLQPLVEMVDFIEASRAYEANLSVIDVTKSLGASALRIIA